MRGALFAIVVSACVSTNTKPATSGPPGAQQQASDDEQVCQEVSRPGSLLTRTECRSKADADADREQMRTWMTTPKASKDFPSTSQPGSGMGPGH
jgi:hypothetical protein